MSKSLAFALLAVVGSLILTDDAQARCRRRARCCMPAASCCAAPACTASCNTCAATVTVTQTAPVATTVNGSTNVASNNGSTYQSFSYEPGSSNNTVTTTTAAPVVTYQAPAPVMTRSSWSEFDNVLRGDRKTRGF